MTDQKQIVHAPDAVSDDTDHVQHCSLETKDPSPAMASATGAAPASATAALAEPSTDKCDISKTTDVVIPALTPLTPLTPTPEDLYTQGMRHHQMGDLDKAMPYLLRAAECNHALAAAHYADALNHLRDLSKSRIWYQRALDLAKGHRLERDLSRCMYRGLAILADKQELYVEALKHFRQGALLGDAKCTYYLGVYMSQGRGVPRDGRAAYYWYRRAEAHGYDCANSIGLPLLRYPATHALSLSDANPALF